MLKNIIMTITEVVEQQNLELQQLVDRLHNALPTIPLANVRSPMFLLHGLYTNIQYMEWYLKDGPTLAYQDALEASGAPLLKQAFLPFIEREPRKYAVLTKYNRKYQYSEEEISRFLEYNQSKLKLEPGHQLAIFQPGNEYYPVSFDLINRHTYESVRVTLDCTCRSFASTRFYPRGPVQWLATHLSRAEFRTWAKQFYDNPDFRAFGYTYDYLEKLRIAKNRWSSKHYRKHLISKKSGI